MSKLYDIRSGTLVKSKLYNNGLILKDVLNKDISDKDKVIKEIFTGNKQGFWYDPSDKSMLFQDEAGTVPVTKDGDPVALMRDKSGNGYHLTQSVINNRPVYRTDGVLHSIDFSGGDNYFNCFTPIPTTPEDRVLSVGLRHNTRRPDEWGSHVVEAFGPGPSDFLNLSMGFFERANFFATYAKYQHAYSYDYDPYEKNLVLTSLALGTNLELKANGTKLVTENTYREGGYTIHSGFRVGCSGTAGERVLNGKIFGMVFILKTLTAEEISSLETYLANQSGATLGQ